MADKGSPSDEDRKILIEWLLARHEVVACFFAIEEASAQASAGSAFNK